MKRKRVLIMEDNISLALEWKEAFELNQFDVVLCGNADEVISYLENESFDLVVTDIFIAGGKGGLHVLAKLSSMLEDAPPAITVTGARIISDNQSETNLFLAQAKRLGSTVNIEKPFPPKELVMIGNSLCGSD